MVAVGEGHDLAGSAAHHRPELALVLTPPHERPSLVEFEDSTGLGREQGFLDGGQAQEFFLTTA